MLERGLGVEREMADGCCFQHRVKDDSQLVLRRRLPTFAWIQEGRALAGLGAAFAWPLLSFPARVQGPVSRGWLSLKRRGDGCAPLKVSCRVFPDVAVLHHGLLPHHLRNAFPRG